MNQIIKLSSNAANRIKEIIDSPFPFPQRLILELDYSPLKSQEVKSKVKLTICPFSKIIVGDQGKISNDTT